jgi:subtilisin family serine protease
MIGRRMVSVAMTLAAAAAGLLVMLSGGAPVSAQGPQIPQALRDRVQRDGQTRVIVELRLPAAHVAEARLPDEPAIARQRQQITDRGDRVLGRLGSASLRLVRRFSTVPFVVVDVTPGALAELERMTDEVASVRLDTIHHPSLAESVPLVEADQVWDSGFDGTGQMIAVLDTGVDGTHPFLTGKVVEEACYSTNQPGTSQSFCPNGANEQLGAGAATPCPLPTCEHGTHVAGIAAGGSSDPSHPFPGVAKGAALMAVQVFTAVIDATTCGGTAPCVGAFTSDIIAGLERVYAVALGGDHHIASINMSLGASNFEAPCDDQPYKPIIDNLRAIGIATVVAAGNDGSSFGLASPACVSSVVSVGATDKQDQVTWFSNTAPFLSLFAPGDSITSSVPGGGYQALSGTSMASPHVAGIWALMKQAVPGASVSTILRALQTTGLPITDDRFDDLFGPGVTVPRVRALRALATLTPITSPVPVITSASPALLHAGIGTTVTLTGTGFNALSTARWNGATKPTQAMSRTILTVTLAASDVAAEGSGQVIVSNPAPGGGLSGALSIPIGPPPRLTIGVPVVAPGEQETVALANGVGGATDYLTLAVAGSSDAASLQRTTVGTGVTDRTWTVTMPTAAGSYEFRLFVGGVRAATSAPVIIDPTYSRRPALTSLSPASVPAGVPSFTLTVNGSNFIATSVVRWNGADRPTTYANTTSLQATIPASDVAAVGAASVTVFTPAPGGGTSLTALPFTIVTRPTLSVDTTTASAGASVTVTLANGLGGGSDWLALAPVGAPDGTYLQWTYVGAGVTTRTWSAALPAQGGAFEFRLFTNGYLRISTSAAITIPRPQLSVDTTAAAVGSKVTVTLTGGYGGAQAWLALARSGAPDTSYVQWTYVGSGITTRTWTVSISAVDTYEFRLFQDGGYTRVATSPAVTIIPGPPAVTSVSPTSAAAGGAAFTLTVNGSGFTTGAIVRWNGADRATTFVGATQLRAAITAADIAATGTAQVTVFLPAPGGGTSSPVPFTITAAPPPGPALAVNQTTVVGGGQVTVTLTNGFGGNTDWLAFSLSSAPDTSYLQWVYVGAGLTSRTWTITVPTASGDYEFRLYRDNGYVRSATSPTFTVAPGIPTVTSIAPATVVVGSPDFTLAVSGTGFTPAALVRWNGADRPTTFVSATQLRASIAAADLSAAATAQVTVFVPPPGGGTSGTTTFTILSSGPPSPALSVNVSTVPAGAPTTVTLTNGYGGATDWIAFASAASPNTGYLQWIYIGAGTTTRTWTIAAPSTPGMYEFRLFLNNGYTRVATSQLVTVQ